MDNLITDKFFALIRTELAGEKLPENSGISLGDLDEILALAGKHDVAQLVIHAASKDPVLREHSAARDGIELYSAINRVAFLSTVKGILCACLKKRASHMFSSREASCAPSTRKRGCAQAAT